MDYPPAVRYLANGIDSVLVVRLPNKPRRVRHSEDRAQGAMLFLVLCLQFSLLLELM